MLALGMTSLYFHFEVESGMSQYIQYITKGGYILRYLHFN